MRPRQRRDNSPFRPSVPPLPVGPEYYDRALELVNYFRMEGNAPFVDMGCIPAAQQHADYCLAMGFASHWDLDGLKPYMRYSQAGGCQPTTVFWRNQTEPAGITDLELMIEDGMTWIFETVGNRRVALDSLFRRVNIGIAWNSHNFMLVVELEGEYVDFDGLPAVANNVLTFAGRVKNGVRLQSEADLSADIWYDPLPRPATVGQLLRVNAYDHGAPVAGLRRPLSGGRYWTEDWVTQTVSRLNAPEDFPANSTVPSNPVEVRALVQEAYLRNERPRQVQISYPWITCSRWDVSARGFAVSADIGSVWRENGPGVYTLALWAPMGERAGPLNIARHSLFLR